MLCNDTKNTGFHGNSIHDNITINKIIMGLDNTRLIPWIGSARIINWDNELEYGIQDGHTINNNNCNKSNEEKTLYVETP